MKKKTTAWNHLIVDRNKLKNKLIGKYKWTNGSQTKIYATLYVDVRFEF